MNRLIIFLFLLFISCGIEPERVIDASKYTEEISVGDIDSTEFLMDYGSQGKRTIYLNIHCTASKEGVDLKAPWFLRFFKNERGWDKPGYNDLIELDGTVVNLVAYDLDGYTTWDEVSYGVAGVNSQSINIAYVGGVDRNLKAKDTRTEAQKRSIEQVVNRVRCSIPNIIVMGHRDHPGVRKSCPSFEVSDEYPVLNLINETREFDFSE